jgi:hypothetical protein
LFDGQFHVRRAGNFGFSTRLGLRTHRAEFPELVGFLVLEGDQFGLQSRAATHRT